MKFTYDPQSDVGYIQFEGDNRETRPFKSRQINEDVYLDIDPDGKVVGIEFLHVKGIGLDPNVQVVAPNPVTLEDMRRKIDRADHPIDRKEFEAERQRKQQPS